MCYLGTGRGWRLAQELGDRRGREASLDWTAGKNEKPGVRNGECKKVGISSCDSNARGRAHSSGGPREGYEARNALAENFKTMTA